MFSIHIDTDHFVFPPYAVMILLSFAIGISAMYIMNVRCGVRKNIAGYLALISPFMSIFAALLTTYITTMGRGIGLSSIGGLSGMYLCVFIMAVICKRREEAWMMFQSCTLILPLMYSISKLGCLFAGCCRGMDYHGVFCVEYSGNIANGICAFPVQLAETLVFLCIFSAGMLLFKKHIRSAATITIILSAAAKILLDFTRASHAGKLISLNQALCLFLLALGAGALLLKKEHSIF